MPSLRVVSDSPSCAELRAAGQLGGPLYPSCAEQDGVRSAEERVAFGQAINAWNRHDNRKAADMFREFWAANPDSAWAAEAKLHVGCDASYNGRYGEAEALFSNVVAETQGRNSVDAQMLLAKARQRLALLKVTENNLDAANSLFTQLFESSDWHHRTYASHWIQRLSLYSGDYRALLNCGALALAQTVRGRDGEDAAKDIETRISDTDQGFAMQDLVNLAASHGFALTGLQLAVSELDTIPLPAILQVQGQQPGDKGHYWVLERITDGDFELCEPQSKVRMRQDRNELAMSWTGRALVFDSGAALPGHRLEPAELESFCGGCCGVARPPSSLGLPRDSCLNPCGAPAWTVNPINMNLFVRDTPLWYSPAIGPAVRITLSYNSQSSIAYHEPVGNKWQLNYASYLVVDTAGTVTLFMPDGRLDVYNPDGSNGYIRPYQVFNTLTCIATNHYELRFPDYTVYEYSIPSGTESQQPFLTEIRDAYSNQLTLGYDTNVQLVSITDAMGQETALQYSPAGLVTNATDPFGRNASFEYDADRNLTRITDMGGFWSALAYDTNVYVTSIGDDRGTWQFYVESADGQDNGSKKYPQPGDKMWEDYRITITDPLGGKEEFHYEGYESTGWHVTPRHYVEYMDLNRNNFALDVPRTKVDYTNMGGYGELKYVIAPDGGRLDFGYDPAGNRISIRDSHGHTNSFTYNGLGLMTSMTEPNSNVTVMAYATNGIDLVSISNGLGVVRLDYNAQHSLTSLVDRLGNTNHFEYNAFGQLVTQTDPLGLQTTCTYDETNRTLTQISRAGEAVASFTYDAFGRVRTQTDATGLTLTFDYNDLNSITRVTYPDDKHEDFTYSTCCPRILDSMTDRAGRTITYTYDSAKRLIQMVNPENGHIRFEYDPDGNLLKLIDPNGNATTWAYDDAGRPVAKTYANGKGETYAYDVMGLLTNRVNARGIVATYAYDANHSLVSINYSDGTASVTNTYDAYNRLVQSVDGTGTNVFTYDANSKLISHDGPWPDNTITYAYDAMERLTNLVAQGSATPTGYAYDSFDRLTGISVGTNIFAYVYTNANPLVQRLDRPNGSATTYAYDNLNRLTGITTRDSAQEIINQFLYTYNAQDLRDTETTSNALAVACATNELIQYDYNNLNQLLASAPPERQFAFDDDGNMTRGYTPDGQVFTATYDAENRLASIHYTNASEVVCSNVCRYAGSHFLAETRSYSNGTLSGQARFVRSGALEVQKRDSTNAVVCEYTWGLNLGGGIGGLLNLRQDGQDYSYVYDGKGNVAAVLDAAQAAVAAYGYDEFGVPVAAAGELDQPFCFSTKPYDPQTGLAYYGYRFYSPGLGRWLNHDPFGEAGGLNLFAYANNNPINYSDSYGENPILIAAIFIVLASAEYAVAPEDENDASNPCYTAGEGVGNMLVTAAIMGATTMAINGVSRVAAESETVRVGRWMSQAEADAMVGSGRVQAPLNGAGATHVTVPPNPTTFTPPTSSSTFVEFNVPSSQLRIHDPGQGWGRVFGPDSIEARLAARQGQPVPTQMPPATQIQPTASVWPRRR